MIFKSGVTIRLSYQYSQVAPYSASIYRAICIQVVNILITFENIEFSHIDGRPRFAKPSIEDGKQVKIAAIDPDFCRGHKPLSLMEFAGRCLISLTSFSLSV